MISVPSGRGGCADNCSAIRSERLTGPIAGLARKAGCRVVEVLVCLVLLLRLSVLLWALPLGIYQRPGPENHLAVTLIRSMERR